VEATEVPTVAHGEDNTRLLEPSSKILVSGIFHDLYAIMII
jgi:hypothetical protein